MDYDRLFVDQCVKNSINSNENRVSAKSSKLYSFEKYRFKTIILNQIYHLNEPDWIVVEVYVSVNAHEEMKTIVLNMAVTVHLEIIFMLIDESEFNYLTLK